jgi:hypothetical protein
MFKLKPSEVALRRSKTGLFLASEIGGGRSNTGSAEIWCGPMGQTLRAVYIPRKGELACGEHARLDISTEPNQPGCWQILATHHRGDFTISCQQVWYLHERTFAREDVDPCLPVHDISPGRVSVMWAEMVERHRFSEGEWYEEPPEWLLPAIKAAKEKATCYHCREPHYWRSTEPTGDVRVPPPECKFRGVEAGDLIEMSDGAICQVTDTYWDWFYVQHPECEALCLKYSGENNDPNGSYGHLTAVCRVDPDDSQLPVEPERCTGCENADGTCMPDDETCRIQHGEES